MTVVGGGVGEEPPGYNYASVLLQRRGSEEDAVALDTL
jgi:hypothetical protein